MHVRSLFKWALRNVVLPISLAPTRTRYLRIAREIDERQRWPVERIKEFQLVRLRLLVQRAVSDSELYRERLGSFRLDANSLKTLQDYSAFPTTTKADIENNFPDGMTAQSRRTKDWQYVGTRGTTRRVVVIHDFQKRDAGRAGELVVMTSDGPFELGDSQVSIPPDACSTFCGIEGARAERVRDHLREIVTRRRGLNQETFSDLRGLVMDRWIRRSRSLPPLDLAGQGESLDRYVAILQAARPKQLIALPEYLRALSAHLLSRNAPPLKIAVVRPMGANMPASWKPAVEQALGGVVRENYGSRELGPMAFDCKYCVGLHVLMDQFLIEVVDRNGHEVADGELGQLLITDLQNQSMPILRYEIGDLARVVRHRCKCGRTTMRLTMEGRIEDAFVRNGAFISSEAVCNYLFTNFGIDQFELIESNNGQLQLRYVRPAKLTISDSELGAQLNSAMGFGGSIRVRATDLIRPESSGKYRYCKSASYAQIRSADAGVADAGV